MTIVKVFTPSNIEDNGKLRILDASEIKDWGFIEGQRVVSFKVEGQWLDIKLQDANDKIYVENDAAKTCHRFSGQNNYLSEVA